MNHWLELLPHSTNITPKACIRPLANLTLLDSSYFGIADKFLTGARLDISGPMAGLDQLEHHTECNVI